MGDLKKWSIFNLLAPEFLQEIRLAFIYDQDVCNPLIVTHDYKLYTVSCNIPNGFKPKLIKSIEGMHIKTMSCIMGPYIFILTYIGEVYVIANKYYNANKHIIDECQLEKLNNKFDNKMVKDITCGRSDAKVLTFSGKLYEARICTNKQTLLINEIHVNRPVVLIGSGYYFAVAVTNDETIHIWNSDFMTTDYKFTAIKKVACGYMHYLVLNKYGNVYACGSNNYGQLGNGTYQSISDLAMVPTIKNILDIATSYNHNISIAMGKDNCIFVWGQCLNQNINVPTRTNLYSIHDAFACYAVPRVMHQPLVCNSNFKMMYSLRNAFNDETTSDLTIKIHGKSIHVHKSILILRCQQFRKKFLEDSVDGVNKHSQCIMSFDKEQEMFSYNVYKAFLQYLYTDKINLPLEDTLELLQLAHYYSMNQLKRHCAQSIHENITVENVLFMYNLALKCDVKELEDFSFKFASRNMTAVIRTPYFVELDGSTVKNFIIKAAETYVFRT